MRVIRGLSSGLSSSYAMKVASYMVALDFFPNLINIIKKIYIYMKFGQHIEIASSNIIPTLDYKMMKKH